MGDYTAVLRILSEGAPLANSLMQMLDSELSMPNIQMPTMGGHVFWDTLAEYNGWKLQQNMIFKNARILNSNDERIAWGTINGMLKVMDRMVACVDRYEKTEEKSGDRIQAMEELKTLKELFDMGALTQQEYQNKKEKIMKRI